MFPKLFEEAYFGYLEYLQDGGSRIPLPRVVHEHKQGYVWPSNLGMCPLQPVLKAEGAVTCEEALPKPLDYHRMTQSTIAAELIQEAFMWRYGDEASVEQPIEKITETYKLRGRTDLLLDKADGKFVIELKNSDELRQGHVIQALTYGLMHNTPLVCIVTFNRSEINLYECRNSLRAIDVFHTAQYKFDSARRMKSDYPNTLWGSVPDLNQIEVEAERHYQYLTGKRDNPMPDFLNDPGGWQCAKKTTYPKDSKPGKFKPTCAYFCHNDIENTEFAKVDNKYIRLVEVF